MTKPATVPEVMRSAVTEGFVGRERSCTDKVAYSHLEAIAAVRGMAKRRTSGAKGRRMSIYRCQFCKLYHLTSG